MIIITSDSLLGWLVYSLFNLVIRFLCFTLKQISNIYFIRQYVKYRCAHHFTFAFFLNPVEQLIPMDFLYSYGERIPLSFNLSAITIALKPISFMENMSLITVTTESSTINLFLFWGFLRSPKGANEPIYSQFILLIL